MKQHIIGGNYIRGKRHRAIMICSQRSDNLTLMAIWKEFWSDGWPHRTRTNTNMERKSSSRDMISASKMMGTVWNSSETAVKLSISCFLRTKIKNVRC